MGWAHPDGWRITTVRLSRGGGPPREYLRLTSGTAPSYWIGDYAHPDELAVALERLGLRLPDFVEDPDPARAAP